IDDGADTGKLKVPLLLRKEGLGDPAELNPGGYEGEPGLTKTPGAFMVTAIETVPVVPMNMLVGETVTVNESSSLWVPFTAWETPPPLTESESTRKLALA